MIYVIRTLGLPNILWQVYLKDEANRLEVDILICKRLKKLKHFHKFI
jgi:hypothetical protein